MADPTPITDYAARIPQRLPSQYRDKPVVLALLAAFSEEAQALEDAITGLLVGARLSGAEGEALDRWAQALNVLRLGLTDPELKGRLYARLAQNSSEGSAPELISILRLLGVDGALLTDIGSATLSVQINGGPYLVPTDQIRGILEAATTAIALDITQVDDPDLAFSFLEDATGLGFDDGTNAPDAGIFAEAL